MKRFCFLLLAISSMGVLSAQPPNGFLCGIGAVVSPDEVLATETIVIKEYIRVDQVIDNGPAKKAGLERGDRIVSVDGKKVAGLNFMKAVAEMIRGKAGTHVKITVMRNGAAETKTFDIFRLPLLVPPTQK
jgi:C-terminal processing protease CtpA/Prc